MKSTTYKLLTFIDGWSTRASIGAIFEPSDQNEIDFHLMQQSNFEDGDFIGHKLPPECSFCLALKHGIFLALKELKIENTKVTITGLYCHLADAADLGYCFAGYQVVYKHYGKQFYERTDITMELLEQTLKKANDLTKRST